MTTVHFKIHWGNAELLCMQKEKENVCKLFSSLLQYDKPEHFYYLGCTWAEYSASEQEPANKEHGRLRKEDMLGLYLYLTSGYFKRKSGNHGWALDIKDLKDHFKIDLHLRT